MAVVADCHVLLRLQYLLHKGGWTGTDAWVYVILPFWQIMCVDDDETNTPTIPDATSNHRLVKLCLQNDGELWKVLVNDSVLVSHHEPNNTVEADHQKEDTLPISATIWQDFITQPLPRHPNTSAAALLLWNVQCHMLLKQQQQQLRHAAPDSASPSFMISPTTIVSFVTQALQKTVALLQQSTTTVTSDDAHDDEDDMELRPPHLLQPLLQDIVPWMITIKTGVTGEDPETNTAVGQLWETVWKEYLVMDDDDNNNKPNHHHHHWIVGTAVLCAMLPHVRDRDDLPNTENAPCRPIQQGQLWRLIETCLAQGLKLHQKNVWVQRQTQQQSTAPEGWSELMRRRGLYLLRVLVEPQRSSSTSKKSNNTKNHKQPKGQPDATLVMWNKYVACLETMEMENETHLILQVWNTVQELAANCDPSPPSASASFPPSLSWSWMHVLWARVLLSPDNPQLRKAALCHLCEGKAGILLTNEEAPTQAPQSTAEPPADNAKADKESAPKTVLSKKARKQQLKQQKAQQAKQKTKKTKSIQGMPLSRMTNDFVIHVLLPCFDSLEQVVGTHHHYEEGGKVVKQNLTELLAQLLNLYMTGMDPTKWSGFLQTLIDLDAMTAIRLKTVAFVIELVANFLQSSDGVQVVLGKSFFRQACDSLTQLLSLGYVLPHYRMVILKSFAVIISFCEPESVIDVHHILDILKLYALPTIASISESENVEATSWISTDASFSALYLWLQKLQKTTSTASWATTAASTVATAFVDGLMSSSLGVGDSSGEPDGSYSQSEIDTGRSIGVLCALLSSSPSGILWPAINKGLSHAPAVAVGNWSVASKVARALLLLEFGCKLQLISGNGNGDLVIDKSNQMMPPPPSIENLLSSATSFLLHRMEKLLIPSEESDKWKSSRSSEAKRVTGLFLGIIGSLESIKIGFPSSTTVPAILEKKLGAAFDDASASTHLEQICTLYACVSGGAEPKELLALSQNALSLTYKGKRQSERSLFVCSKWGSLGLLSQQCLKIKESSSKSSFFKTLFREASDSVEACPTEGLLFLFDCIAISTRSGVTDEEDGVKIENAIDSMFAVLDATASTDSMYVLDQICSILFNTDMLLGEANALKVNKKAPAPVRKAFRRLMKMAGTSRPHILRAALAKICTAWTGFGEERGLSALPYREDIFNLLSYKEDSIEASAVKGTSQEFENALADLVPKGTHEQSVARAFVLCFLERLAEANSELPSEVQTNLIEYLILRLLRDRGEDQNKLDMRGSPEYVKKIRNWQALCVMSRYVNEDIVDKVSKEAFDYLKIPLHGQVRYFTEVFCIQCGRRFPKVFGKLIGEHINRRDLNNQEVSSIMIIAGNLIVGRYRGDFLADKTAIDLHAVLAGASPWLSSTQGFSRGIAQLLVHAIIPMVIDVKEGEAHKNDSNWHLRSLFNFLDENPEMKRLRVKQSSYFDTYDADKACTPEFIFSVTVDEGGEANPENMVDIIKQCLIDVYDEAHGEDVPVWKQVQDMTDVDESESEDAEGEESHEVNFQRKIVPLETLNLAFEEAKERRLRNIAGRRKQPLIVCASLIDKIPNLGGLARTSEIFSATKLIIPDLKVTKMDNFTSLSVGAGEWIEIEECKEEVSNLLFLTHATYCC